MYLTKAGDGNYWLWSEHKARTATTATIADLFTDSHWFDPHPSAPDASFIKKGNTICWMDNENRARPDATILVEFPDDFTYEQLVETHPELFL